MYRYKWQCASAECLQTAGWWFRSNSPPISISDKLVPPKLLSPSRRGPHQPRPGEEGPVAPVMSCIGCNAFSPWVPFNGSLGSHRPAPWRQSKTQGGSLACEVLVDALVCLRLGGPSSGASWAMSYRTESRKIIQIHSAKCGRRRDSSRKVAMPWRLHGKPK